MVNKLKKDRKVIHRLVNQVMDYGLDWSTDLKWKETEVRFEIKRFEFGKERFKKAQRKWKMINLISPDSLVHYSTILTIDCNLNLIHLVVVNYNQLSVFCLFLYANLILFNSNLQMEQLNLRSHNVWLPFKINLNHQLPCNNLPYKVNHNCNLHHSKNWFNSIQTSSKMLRVSNTRALESGVLRSSSKQNFQCLSFHLNGAFIPPQFRMCVLSLCTRSLLNSVYHHSKLEIKQLFYSRKW